MKQALPQEILSRVDGIMSYPCCTSEGASALDTATTHKMMMVKPSVLMTSFCMLWAVASLYHGVKQLSSTESSSIDFFNNGISRDLQNGFDSGISESALPFNISFDRPPAYRPFPRWGATLEEENELGIDLAPVLDFIANSSVAAFARKQQTFFEAYIPTSDHGDAVGKWFPEVLYVIDHQGIWNSRRHRDICALDLATMNDKLVPMEKMMMEAFRLIQSNERFATKHWPRLTHKLFHQPNNASSGFPVLFWFGDYTECNYQNWKGMFSLPIFTFAASVHCNYSFPFVTYQTRRDANVLWEEVIPQQHQTYPWKEKRKQIVWRGSLTGKIVNATHKSPRWNMLQKIMELRKQFDERSTASVGDPGDLFWFNVSATRLPPRHKDWASHLPEIGGLGKNMEMDDFQHFRGILDIDGNSWSSRFGRLLCYSSVVLKVEPSWVDYFHFKEGPEKELTLQPWVHYIPVKADLSDLVEKTSFVLDSKNDGFLMNMVDQANSWCRSNMNRRSISMDVLNIWERYVELLDIGDPEWSESQWRQVKQEIFHSENALRMDNTVLGVK